MLKPLLKKIAGSMPLSVHRLITKRDVLGFYYHAVSDEHLPHIRHLYPYKSTRQFEKDLLYLTANFDLVTYSQLAVHHSGGQRLKPDSAVLTFDDGLAECYSVVRPLLLKHAVPCIFFVPTDYVDNQRMCPEHKASLCVDRILSLVGSDLSSVVKSARDALSLELDNATDLVQWAISAATQDRSAIDHLCRLLGVDVRRYLETQRPYMTADELRQLVAGGFTVGAHSVSHRRFDSLADSEAEEDIVASCDVIMSLTGQSSVPFAFPFSADGVSRDMLRGVRERHEHVGLLFGTGGILRDRDFIINRMCGDRPEGPDPDASNLPTRIAGAYLEELALRVRGLW